jgi:hypothetical protein
VVALAAAATWADPPATAACADDEEVPPEDEEALPELEQPAARRARQTIPEASTAGLRLHLLTVIIAILSAWGVLARACVRCYLRVSVLLS